MSYKVLVSRLAMMILMFLGSLRSEAIEEPVGLQTNQQPIISKLPAHVTKLNRKPVPIGNDVLHRTNSGRVTDATVEDRWTTIPITEIDANGNSHVAGGISEYLNEKMPTCHPICQTDANGTTHIVGVRFDNGEVRMLQRSSDSMSVPERRTSGRRTTPRRVIRIGETPPGCIKIGETPPGCIKIGETPPGCIKMGETPPGCIKIGDPSPDSARNDELTDP